MPYATPSIDPPPTHQYRISLTVVCFNQKALYIIARLKEGINPLNKVFFVQDRGFVEKNKDFVQANRSFGIAKTIRWVNKINTPAYNHIYTGS